MKKITPKVWIIAVVVLMAAALGILSFKAAAAGTVTVAKSTSAGENQPGWLFNRDSSTAAPYTFNFNAHSIGMGALYVGPITNSNFGGVTGNDPNKDMFVAEFFPGTVQTSELNSLSYDYLLGSTRPDSDNQLVTISIYTNIDNSQNDFDCRFDYRASTGSSASFVKPIIFAGMAPTDVVKNGDRITDCAKTLDGMPAGSHIRVIKLFVGNDTAADTGLDAYFDNFEVVINGDATTYNFEAAPQSVSDCDGKKWQQYKFKNQGMCQKYVNQGVDTR